jgi:hypothetical protein
MTYTTIEQAPLIIEAGKEHTYFWSFRETGVRQRLNPAERSALGLDEGEWMLSEVRCTKDGDFWAIFRHGDRLAYGVVPNKDILWDVVGWADDKAMSNALSQVQS